MKFFPTVPLVLKLILLSFGVYFFSWASVYSLGINRVIIPSEDVLPSTYLPVSLIKEIDFDLNEYADFFIKKYPNPDDHEAMPFYMRLINGRYVSGFPIVNVPLAFPVYVLPVLLASPEPNSLLIPILGKLAAAFIASLSVGVMYLVLKELGTRRQAIVLTLLYAFATSVFALSSQGMWQHGPTQLFLALGLLSVVKGEKGSKWVKWGGLFLCLAVLTRPTSIVPAGLMSFYVFLKHPRQNPSFLGLSLLPILFWLIYNHIYYGSILTHAYNTGVGTEGNWTGRFPEGFLGLWLSPSKGLLVYSPIFILSLWGMVKVWRGQTENVWLFRVISLSVLTFTLMMGRWYHWFGGWSFSYRMAVDVVPLLIVLMVPIMSALKGNRLSSLFYALAIYSVIIQMVGIVFFDGEWHARFDNGPKDTSWLWSINNSELVYYGKKTVCRLKTANRDDYLICQELGVDKGDQGK